MGDSRKKAKSTAAAGPKGDALLQDDAALRILEAAHPEGISSAAIVELFTSRGVALTEAAFRKYVQAGAVPRSHRVGRKGKHLGSHGIYPAAVIGRIALVKRRIGEGMTLEEIATALSLRASVEQVGQLLTGFFDGVTRRLPGLDDADRRGAEKQLEQARQKGAELVERIDLLERRVVAPVLREAKARAFASGTAGGAGDLL